MYSAHFVEDIPTTSQWAIWFYLLISMSGAELTDFKVGVSSLNDNIELFVGVFWN
jgi:hypothetical protein